MKHKWLAFAFVLSLLCVLSGMIGISEVMADLSSGLVAYYPFNGNANDASGNGHNGTVLGATLTTDPSGNSASAYSFDGNDYVSVPDSSVLPIGSNSFTVATWAKFGSYSGDSGYYLLGQSTAGGNVNKWIFFLGNTGINFITYPAGWIGLGSYNFQSGKWYHVGITDNGSILTAYVNGSPIGSAGAGTIGDVSNPFFMGGVGPAEDNYHPGRIFVGAMDDVRIYNRALTGDEMAALAAPVPLPSSCLFLITGLSGLIAAGWTKIRFHVSG
jgi:hypothetical protein